MLRNPTERLAALTAAGILAIGLAHAPASQAFNFGDMMNPGKWMGGSDYDDYDDWYDYGPSPYGSGPYGGPWGAGPYGGGPYGWPGYGAPSGWGAPGYYGAPGAYGAPPYRPGPRPPATASKPKSSSSSSENVKSAEIEALKRRIDELEAKQQTPTYAPPPSDWGSSSPKRDWGSAPAFRPMSKY